MSLLPKDIKEDEIRIISSEKNRGEIISSLQNKFSEESLLPAERETKLLNPEFSIEKKNSAFKIKWNKWLILGVVLFIGALVVFFWWEVKKDVLSDEKQHLHINKIESDSETFYAPAYPHNTSREKGYVETYDTIINKEPFSIFIPKNLTPELSIGDESLQDTSAAFIVRAADIRKDNGGIVGAYVNKGNLLSKGQAKAGFCAIIDGQPIIGIAESTPYLEKAIETDGYFFRQYPLVVEGQPVDNRLDLSSLRKALAELNGETVVIMSHNRMTLNEFSRYLVDLGVKNAIYLVGSSTFGFAIDKDGNKIEFGKTEENPAPNVNYLVWK